MALQEGILFGIIAMLGWFLPFFFVKLLGLFFLIILALIFFMEKIELNQKIGMVAALSGIVLLPV